MLNALRSIVQEVNSAKSLQAALDVIVRRVKAVMKTQVCSVYLMDSTSQRYVLMATEGLNPSAVGNVSLAVSEGIIGSVVTRAEPLNIEDATTHPSYLFIMETGEEPFHAFLGVPIIHQRKVLGVLVVQQRERRRFHEGEEAFLVTMSAQLAGVIAHAEVTGGVSISADNGNVRVDAKFDGVAGASGVAIGTVVVMGPPADLDAVPHRTTDDPGAEVLRFRAALEEVRRDIRIKGRLLAQRLKGEEQALFEVYLRMLDDNAIPGEVEALIHSGIWAPRALRDVIQNHVDQFNMMEDPYLRERASDIRDLGRRMLACLQQSRPESDIEFPKDTILMADEITPTMLGEVPSDRLIGLVSVQGSGNSHTAILARSMGIPTVMGVVDLPYTLVHGRRLIVDGYSGRVFVNPSVELTRFYAKIMREEKRLSKGLEALRDLPSITTDGYTMPLWVNTGLVTDVQLSLDRGAQGIGLYRSEVPFMIKDFFPSEAEQVVSYRKQLQPFAPFPVTMRTLDVGGDKPLPYFPIQEENPSLGWRGIRVTLDHPEIFLVQVRAMLLASEGLDNLRILLPMISNVMEIDESVALIEQALTELRDEGHSIARPDIGVMIEVPAAVYQIHALARRVDFVSVGSNDLTQYLLAVDRNNPRVAGLYYTFHPAVLTALQYIVEGAHKEGVQVGICGELAGDPGGALLLMAMGYDVLSMNSTNLPKVKSAIRGVSREQANALLKEVMLFDNPGDIQETIRASLVSLGLGQLNRPASSEGD